MPVHLTRWTAAAALAASLLVGCTGKEPEPEPPDPFVELGTGEREFEGLADGDTLYIVQGPQGGFHFNGSLLAGGINSGNPDNLGDASNPTIRFRVMDGTTQVDTGANNYTQGLRDGSEPFHYQLIGRRVILDIEQDDDLDGVEVTFEVEITDADGTVVSDSRTVVGVPHPLNNTAF